MNRPFEICAIWIDGIGKIAEGDYFQSEGKYYRVWKCISGSPNKFLTTSGKIIPVGSDIRKAENVNVEFFETLECITNLNTFYETEFKQQERRSQLSRCIRVWSPKHPFSYLKLQRLTETKNQNN